MRNRALLDRARSWVQANQCPLPMDLAVELLAAGFDVRAVEDQLLDDSTKD